MLKFATFSTDLPFKKINLHAFVLAILAIALQVQITILAKENYMGLRISLADIFLLILCPLFLYLLVTKKISAPRWNIKHGWFWIAGLLCVMTIALIQGHVYTGTWSQWAFFNKYCGFWALMAYFTIGGVLATNAKDYSNSINFFVSVFCGFFVCVLALTMILAFAEVLFETTFALPLNPWAGYMVNRNAYMVLAVFVMLCIILSHIYEKMAVPNWISALFWFLLPFFIVYNSSRTGWVVMGIFLLAFAIKCPKTCFKKILLPSVLGIALLMFSLYGAGIRSTQGAYQVKHMVNLVKPSTEMYNGDTKRLISYEDAMGLYKVSGNPLLGGGLGSYQDYQTKKRGQYVDVIDFTGLWLLVETGALGLLAFTAFFIVCIFTLYRTWRSKNTHPFLLAVLIFMLCFAGMSLLHELLYTRFLWFIMGLALASAAQSSNLDSGGAKNDDKQRGQEE